MSDEINPIKVLFVFLQKLFQQFQFIRKYLFSYQIFESILEISPEQCVKIPLLHAKQKQQRGFATKKWIGFIFKVLLNILQVLFKIFSRISFRIFVRESNKSFSKYFFRKASMSFPNNSYINLKRMSSKTNPWNPSEITPEIQS